jgi:drug/metabolite transporter (DMT)-like permease
MIEPTTDTSVSDGRKGCDPAVRSTLQPITGIGTAASSGHPTEPGFRPLAASGSVLRGIALMTLSGLFDVSMNVIIRYVAAEVHPFEIAFFRSLFGFAVLIPLILRAGDWSVFRAQRFGLHVLRAVFNVAGMLAFFLALSMAPLAEVAALNFTSPLFAAVLAAFVLHERVGLRRRIGLVVGFLGALIILRPGLTIIGPGALMTLVAAISWACALVIIKLLTRTESSLTITAYAALLATVLSLPAALFVWQWPSLGGLAWLILIGFLGSLAQLCLVQAFAESDTSVVLPFDFLKLVWASLFGFLFFFEMPDWGTWLGGTVIFASVTYIAYRERQAEAARVPTV